MYQFAHDPRRPQMDDTKTPFPTLTALARRTGVAEYRLAMFATALSLPVITTLIAALV
jgi:hypothetical protein